MVRKDELCIMGHACTNNKNSSFIFFLSREAFKEIGREGKGGGADIAKNINNLCGSHWTIILLFVL